ncbi:PREDICTED: uncharacterized protein LOC109133109 [Camelina sativa]|uniref:Uncharacterized protein LOC109133109 n=1 Tax=Camelina sativa TaxID=90675 RepID=A0ABM1RRA9_CAMSA|nr:PREDICTED: uncharacterized protein LOC109133109 [Camelina sativa]
MELKGVQPPMPKTKSLKRLRKRASADTKIVKVDSVTSREGDLNLKISLPDGYHFSKEARSKFVVDVEPENEVAIDPMEGNLSPDGSTMFHFRQSSTSASVVKISCKVYYCKEDEVCLYQSVQFEVPFKVESESSSSPTITFTVKPRASYSGGLQLQGTR